MFNAICFLLLCTAPLMAESVSEAAVQTGRYQLVANNGILYLLDTATGEVWKESYWDGWKPYWPPIASELEKLK